jgi:hypothetical protein
MYYKCDLYGGLWSLSEFIEIHNVFFIDIYIFIVLAINLLTGYKYFFSKSFIGNF